MTDLGTACDGRSHPRLQRPLLDASSVRLLGYRGCGQWTRLSPGASASDFGFDQMQAIGSYMLVLEH